MGAHTARAIRGVHEVPARRTVQGDRRERSRKVCGLATQAGRSLEDHRREKDPARTLSLLICRALPLLCEHLRHATDTRVAGVQIVLLVHYPVARFDELSV